VSTTELIPSLTCIPPPICPQAANNLKCRLTQAYRRRVIGNYRFLPHTQRADFAIHAIRRI